METVAFICAAVLAAGLGFVVGRYVWPAVRAIDASALTKAQTDTARLEQECSVLRGRIAQLDIDSRASAAEAKKAGEEVARLNERVAVFTKHIEDQGNEISTIELRRDTFATEAKVAGAEVAQLRERETSLTQKIQEQAGQLSEQQKQLTTEFENIANRILAANAVDLSKTSQKTLETIVNPLRERIKEFENKVEDTYKTESREVLSLKEQIKLMLETSNTIGSQADGLAKALRGDSQLLGRWGELALERILEAAGLTEGREYVTQGRGLRLKSEDGGSQKPDVVVFLPEKRTMIIDSKVPLASYERLISAKDEVTRKASSDLFVKDVKGHIDDLAGKRYQENEKLEAHDCALMFVPIEGALAAALNSEPELFVYAWERRVVLVGPSTLFMTMRTVSSIWRYELQGENAQEIAKLAGELCDKVSTSLAELNSVSEKIMGALAAHNEAVKRLSLGRGNVLSIGDRIRNLGVKTKRPIPAMLAEDAPIAPQTEASDEINFPENEAL